MQRAIAVIVYNLCILISTNSMPLFFWLFLSRPGRRAFADRVLDYRLDRIKGLRTKSSFKADG